MSIFLQYGFAYTKNLTLGDELPMIPQKNCKNINLFLEFAKKCH